MNTTYSLAERVRRFIRDIPMKIAWKLPKSVVMWAGYRVVAHATTGAYSAQHVHDLEAMTALARWSDDFVDRKSQGSES